MKYNDGDKNEQLLSAYSMLSAILSTLNISMSPHPQKMPGNWVLLLILFV